MGHGEQVEKNIESDKGIRARLGKVLIDLPFECPFPFEFQLNDIVCQINFQVRLTLRISTPPSNEWPKTDFSQISNARTKPPTISSVSKTKSL